MNATFEAIRKELKKYNVEDNEAPPKLVVADRNIFMDMNHKRRKNTQFIIGVKEFVESEKFLIERMLDDLEIRSGQKPLAFLYDERDAIENVIEDFQDYYNTTLSNDLFQKIGSHGGQDKLLYYLIIVVLEIYYYES